MFFSQQPNCAICYSNPCHDGGILCRKCAGHGSRTHKVCKHCQWSPVNSDGVLCDECYYKGLREESNTRYVRTSVVYSQPIPIPQRICRNSGYTQPVSSSSHQEYYNTCEYAYQQGQQRAYQQGSGWKPTCRAPYCTNMATQGEYCSSHPQRVRVTVTKPVQAHYVPPFVPVVVQPKKLKPCANHCGQTIKESEYLCSSCSRIAKEKGLYKCNVTGCNNMIKLEEGRCNNCAYQASFAGKLGLQPRVEPQKRVNHW